LLGLIEEPQAIHAILESLTISADVADRAQPEIARGAELAAAAPGRRSTRW